MKRMKCPHYEIKVNHTDSCNCKGNIPATPSGWRDVREGEVKSSIAILISKKMCNGDERTRRLFYNDPFFHAAYKKLLECGNNESDVILDIIMSLCESRKETSDMAIKTAQEYSLLPKEEPK